MLECNYILFTWLMILAADAGHMFFNLPGLHYCTIACVLDCLPIKRG